VGYDRSNRASLEVQASPKKGGLEMSVRGTPMKESQIGRRIESLIDRRIKFLISEARLKYPIRDQTITYAFRVVTNHFSGCNYDIPSSLLREKCPYRSKEAHALFKKYLKRNDQKGWLDKVTNEHQYPIKCAWDWMKKEPDKLNVQRVKNRLKKWPVVVVTKEENESLRHVRAIEPDQRYHEAGIEVLKKPDQDQMTGSREDH
jgi:hypothetical protein